MVIRIEEADVVHIDMPPAAGPSVHDAQAHRPSGVTGAQVDRPGRHGLAVRSGEAGQDPAGGPVDEAEVKPVDVVAAPDEGGDIFAFGGKEEGVGFDGSNKVLGMAAEVRRRLGGADEPVALLAELHAGGAGGLVGKGLREISLEAMNGVGCAGIHADGEEAVVRHQVPVAERADVPPGGPARAVEIDDAGAHAGQRVVQLPQARAGEGSGPRVGQRAGDGGGLAFRLAGELGSRRAGRCREMKKENRGQGGRFGEHGFCFASGVCQLLAKPT